jgi:hypothetical protein
MGREILGSRNLLERVEELKVILVGRATGKSSRDARYRELREALLRERAISAKLPRFVQTCATLGEFWEFIKELHGTYEERRHYVRTEFAPAIGFLTERRPSSAQKRQEAPARREATRPESDSQTTTSTQVRRTLSVFLCHASSDKPTVREIHKCLKAHGIQVWLDEEDLVGGQDWHHEIARAVRTRDVVLVCLTRNSVMKDGFVQREVGYALDRAEEKPEGTIYIIPVRLEECDVPDRLRRWQWVDYFAARGFEKLMAALKKQARALGTAVPGERHLAKRSRVGPIGASQRGTASVASRKPNRPTGSRAKR